MGIQAVIRHIMVLGAESLCAHGVVTRRQLLGRIGRLADAADSMNMREEPSYSAHTEAAAAASYGAEALAYGNAQRATGALWHMEQRVKHANDYSG